MRIFSFERQLRRKNLAQIIEENRIKIVISPMLKGPAFSFEQVLFRKEKISNAHEKHPNQMGYCLV